MPRNRTSSFFALALCVAGVALVARADGGPTLHEFVPDVSSEEGALVISSGGDQPEAILYRGEVLTAPSADEPRGDEATLRAGQGDGRDSEEPGRRSPGFRPDRVTELQGSVGYFTVFTPTIAPFKRMTSLDTAQLDGGVPVLRIANRGRVEVEVEGARAAPPDDRPRDSFWGSVVLDFSEGATVPFPSVAPESRVLTLQTEPAIELRIEKDLADNFYATVVGPARPSDVRAVFLMDAPAAYFGAQIPDGPMGTHASDVAPLPASVQADAIAFAGQLGLAPGRRFRPTLETLTRYFRSFTESERPPNNTGNIYLDLARGRLGICRHRAYAFVITAVALGMRARFVHNEAHAWVEVLLPRDAGWLRIDLGGAATGLEARGAGERPLHQPREPDSLPRPQEYLDAYAEARRMSGLREPESPEAAGDSPGAAGAEGNGGAQGGGSGSGGAAPNPSRRRCADGQLSGPRGDCPGEPSRGALQLALDRDDYEVFRGQVLEVTGVARGVGASVAGLRIETLLRAQRSEAEWLLGVTVTREEGRFRGVFGVPPQLPVGDYQLLVRTPGNDDWAPATAR